MIATYILEHYTKESKKKVLALAKSIIEAHINDIEQVDDNSALIKSLTDELAKLERKLNTLIEMRTEGEISKELFKAKTEEAEIRMNEIKTKLFALQPSEDTPTTEDYSKKLELLNLLLERLTDFSIPSEIPDQVVEAFIKKIVVYQDHTDWYLRIKDEDESPIKAEISGNAKSGLKAIFNGEIKTTLSTEPPRQHSKSKIL